MASSVFLGRFASGITRGIDGEAYGAHFLMEGKTNIEYHTGIDLSFTLFVCLMAPIPNTWYRLYEYPSAIKTEATAEGVTFCSVGRRISSLVDEGKSADVFSG